MWIVSMWIGLSLLRRMEKDYLLIAVFCATIALMAIDIISLETLDVIFKENRESVFHTVSCGTRSVQITDRKCAKRLLYLRRIERHDCFRQYGIFNKVADCKLLQHLIFIEKVCPQSLAPAVLENETVVTKTDVIQSRSVKIANRTRDIQGLLAKLKICGHVCDWMKNRINSTKSYWFKAAKNFFANTKKYRLYGKRRQLTILLHMGLLSKEHGLDFGRKAFEGGPLGELVQWADLIAVLYYLGHEVVLSWSTDRLREILIDKEKSFNSCKRALIADLVFTDITGLNQMRRILGTIHFYRCRLRILDVFGTEPEFNHPRYCRTKSKCNRWAGIGLDPRQFFTQFPHTPDNSFLGFAVHQAVDEKVDVNVERCLLYGKQLKYYNNNNVGTHFLDTVRKYFPDMHATMTKNEIENKTKQLPSYVINHGALNQKDFLMLLRSTRLYVGLGQPVEGPAPLEAIANGVTFLNPKFSPPLKYHVDKPTNRTLTSQQPYVEMHIGQPYSYTVNIDDKVELNAVLKKIKHSKPNKKKVQHEFTHLGFLERINAYVENQDFCKEQYGYDISTGAIWRNPEMTWPPLSSLKIKLSNKAESCASCCRRYNLTCDRSYFPIINQETQFDQFGLDCTKFKSFPSRAPRSNSGTMEDTCHAPSIDLRTDSCTIQNDNLLMSCACVPAPYIERLCPCRGYKPENIAMCLHCE